MVSEIIFQNQAVDRCDRFECYFVKYYVILLRIYLHCREILLFYLFAI